MQDAFLSLFSLLCDGINYILPSEQLLFNRFQRGTYLTTSNRTLSDRPFRWLCSRHTVLLVFYGDVAIRLRGFLHLYTSACLWTCIKTSNMANKQ